MKWNELRKIAKAKGWRYLKDGGRHEIWIHDKRPDLLIIERHEAKEIAPGLYHKLKKQIGF